MRISGFARHYITIAVIVFCFAIAIAITTIIIETSYLTENAFEALEKKANLIEFSLSQLSDSLHIERFLIEMAEKADIDIVVFTNDTSVVNGINIKDLESILLSDIDISTPQRKIDMISGKKYTSFMKPIKLHPEYSYTLMLTAEFEDEQMLKKSAITHILALLSVLMILLVFLYYLLLSSIQRKMMRVKNHIHKLTDGKIFSETDKINDLVNLEQSIKHMTDSYVRLYNDLNFQKANLLIILDALDEGVLVIDSSQNIKMINRLAEDILRVTKKDVKGKNALSVIRIPEIRQLIEKQEDQSIEFPDNSHYLSAHTYKIHYSGMRLITIRNITEQHNTQKLRSDFVSNVSHELRTPITIIKGFAETLEGENLTEEQKRYAGTITRHTDRLISIINDLLTLSKVEHSQYISFEAIDLTEVVDEIIQLYSHKAESRGISINNNCPESSLKVRADRSLLEIVISNLIDNAIKYNKDNGEVFISQSIVDHYAVLSVRDTGPGISEDDQTRIFERFYTVDKARSHRLGGTGLGLSLIKRIVMLHEGKVELKSVLDVGSEFSVKIPIYDKP